MVDNIPPPLNEILLVGAGKKNFYKLLKKSRENRNLYPLDTF